MPPHNGLILGQQQPVQAAMTLAQPFNDVQMVALLAAYLSGHPGRKSGAKLAIEDAQDILIESFRQRERLGKGLQAIMKAEAEAI